MPKRRAGSSMVGKGFAAGKVTLFGPYGTPRRPLEIDLSNESVRKHLKKIQEKPKK